MFAGISVIHLVALKVFTKISIFLKFITMSILLVLSFVNFYVEFFSLNLTIFNFLITAFNYFKLLKIIFAQPMFFDLMGLYLVFLSGKAFLFI